MGIAFDLALIYDASVNDAERPVNRAALPLCPPLTTVSRGRATTAPVSWDLLAIFIRSSRSHDPDDVPPTWVMLLSSQLLPRIFGYLAVAPGVGFELVGIASIFSTPIALTIVLVAAQAQFPATGIALTERATAGGRHPARRIVNRVSRPASKTRGTNWRLRAQQQQIVTVAIPAAIRGALATSALRPPGNPQSRCGAVRLGAASVKSAGHLASRVPQMCQAMG